MVPTSLGVYSSNIIKLKGEMMKIIKILMSMLLCASLSYAESIADQKKAINNESQETLKMLYKAYPSSEMPSKKLMDMPHLAI
jgi:hypothetical protein